MEGGEKGREMEVKEERGEEDGGWGGPAFKSRQLFTE